MSEEKPLSVTADSKEKSTDNISSSIAKTVPRKKKEEWRMAPSTAQLREKIKKLDEQQNESLRLAERLEEKIDEKNRKGGVSSSTIRPQELLDLEIDRLLYSVTGNYTHEKWKDCR